MRIDTVFTIPLLKILLRYDDSQFVTKSSISKYIKLIATSEKKNWIFYFLKLMNGRFSCDTKIESTGIL